MKVVNLLFIAFILTISCFSQDIKTIEIPRGAQRQSRAIVDGITTHNYAKERSIPINGTPYLKKEFLPGILELNDGSKSDELPLRYNVAGDVFEVIQNTDTLSLNQPFKLKQVIYSNKIFIFDPQLRPKAERKYNGFFEVKINDREKLSLYVKRNKDLLYDSFTSNYQGGSGTKEYYYVDKVSYVGKFPDSSGFLINSRKNFLKEIDTSKRLEVKTFIKKNNIRFKDEEDIVKLIKFVNSI